MESLIKQRRVGFSDRQPRESDITGQLSESVIEIGVSIGNKLQDWFQNQFSRQNQNYDAYPDKDYAVAMAAAAYSIHSREEAEEEHRRKMGQEIELSRTKLGKPSSGRVTRRSSGKELKNRGEASSKNLLERDRRVREGATPTRRPSRSPSLGAIFDQKQKDNVPRNKSVQETRADAWERAQMEKINKRFEKIKFGIISWENEKKKQARLKMEKKKSELERRRAANHQHYLNKMARIDHIAAGARTQAEEKNKKRQSEIKRKARMMRSRGKPTVNYCFCF